MLGCRLWKDNKLLISFSTFSSASSIIFFSYKKKKIFFQIFFSFLFFCDLFYISSSVCYMVSYVCLPAWFGCLLFMPFTFLLKWKKDLLCCNMLLNEKVVTMSTPLWKLLISIFFFNNPPAFFQLWLSCAYYKKSTLYIICIYKVMERE